MIPKTMRVWMLLVVLCGVIAQTSAQRQTQAKTPITADNAMNIDRVDQYNVQNFSDIDPDEIYYTTSGLAYSPDGSLLVYAPGTAESEGVVIDTATDDVLYRLDDQAPFAVETFTFSPDNRWLAYLSDVEITTGERKGSLKVDLRVLDARTGEVVASKVFDEFLALRGNSFSSLQFSPDGTEIAFGYLPFSGVSAGAVAIVPLERDGEKLHIGDAVRTIAPTPKENGVFGVLFDYMDDGGHLAICLGSSDLAIYDSQTGERTQAISQTFGCGGLQFIEQDQTLALLTGQWKGDVFESEMQFFDLAKNHFTDPLYFGVEIRAYAFTSNNLLITTEEVTLTMWDLTTLQPLVRTLILERNWDTFTFTDVIRNTNVSGDNARIAVMVNTEILMEFEIENLTTDDYLARADTLSFEVSVESGCLFAILDYNRIIEINDENTATAYLGRGICQFSAGHQQTGLDDVTQAITLEYKPLDRAYVTRSILYKEMGNLDAALADLTTAIDINQYNDSAYYYRARIYSDDLNDWATATEDYRMNAVLVPSGHSYNLWAWSLVQIGDYDGALEAVNIALEYNPDYGAAIDTRGWAYLGLKQYDEAEADFKNAALNYDVYYSYYGLGRLYWEQGDSVAALNFLDKYFSNTPEDRLEQAAIDLADAIRDGEEYAAEPPATDEDQFADKGGLGDLLGEDNPLEGLDMSELRDIHHAPTPTP